MQLFKTYTIGIEITKNSALMVALQGTARGCKLTAHETLTLDSSLPTKDRIAGLGVLINNFIRENDIYSPDILIAVPRKIVILKEVTFPLSVKESLRETMRYEVEKYIPFSLSEIYFDSMVVDEDKKNNVLTALLAVAKKDALDPYFALQTEIGSLSVVETSSTILAYSFGDKKNIPQEDQPFFLLYNEEDGLQCNVVKNGFLLQSQRIAEESTETRNKKIHNLICSARSTSQTTKATQTIYYLNGNNAMPLATGFVDKIQAVKFPTPELLPESRLIPAYFLALKGQKQTTGSINLLPKNFRKQTSRTHMFITAALLGLILLLSAAIIGNFLYRKNMIKVLHADEVLSLSKEANGIPELEENLSILNAKISYLDQIEQSQSIPLDILNELTLQLPSNAWINRFQLSDKSVQLDGSAESTSELIELLESSRLFEDVAFLSTVRVGKDGREAFSIGLKLHVPQVAHEKKQ